MKSTSDWRQHLSRLVNARLDVLYAVHPAPNSHYLQRAAVHRRTGMKVKEGACQLWSPSGIHGGR